MTQKLAQFTDIRAALLVGGLSLQAQAATLRTSPEIIVGTPVRGAGLADRIRGRGKSLLPYREGTRAGIAPETRTTPQSRHEAQPC